MVTIQDSKGGGLASGFSSANNVMGVRRSTDMIEKVTWWLAGIMCLLCVVVAKWTPTVQHAINKQESVINDYVDQATIPHLLMPSPSVATPLLPQRPPQRPPQSPLLRLSKSLGTPLVRAAVGCDIAVYPAKGLLICPKCGTFAP